MKVSRRHFLHQSLASAALLATASGSATAFTQQSDDQWFDVTLWGVEGRAWGDQPRQRYFDRLPAKAEGVVRGAVWNLSRHSSGMLVRFRTDSSTILVDYSLLSSSLAMPHMPATGVSGVDLYGQVEDQSYRWVNVTKPSSQQVKGTLVSGLPTTMRTYQLYLPLYNGVETLSIGVPSGAQFEPLAPRTTKPLLFYGTSIMHGACASRPGMAIPALVGRWLDRPTINLGFSGNGKMDPELAPLLAELDPAVFCIDCLPNMNPNLVRERAVPFVQKLRQARPDTPILLVEDRVFTNARFFPAKQNFHQENHQALRDAYETLTKAGDSALYYLEGNDLLGHDGEGATDGSHPNDLGFLRNAEAYAQVLKPLLT